MQTILKVKLTSIRILLITKINKRINRYVGTLVTLDKGEAQWEEWKSNHP